MRAAAYLSKGEFDRAIADWREAVQLTPDHPSAHLILGFALQAGGKLGDEAAAAYREAIRLKPDNAYLRNRLAWALATVPDTKLRDPAQALVHARKAVELAPA